jgi:hypothetical protein
MGEDIDGKTDDIGGIVVKVDTVFSTICGANQPKIQVSTSELCDRCHSPNTKDRVRVNVAEFVPIGENNADVLLRSHQGSV